MVEILTIALFLIPIIVTLILKRYLESKKQDISLKGEATNINQDINKLEVKNSEKEEDSLETPLKKAMREADEKRARGEKIPWDEDPYLAHIPGNKYRGEFSKEIG